MSDGYKFWTEALAGKNPPMHEADPQFGFYRMRSRSKLGPVSWKPVAYYPEPDGSMHCTLDGESVSEHKGQDIWTFCGQFPVSEAAWREVVENGGDWPDQDAVVASQTRGVGDNSGTVDAAEELADQIKSAAAGKSKYTKIDSADKSAQAQSLRSRLLELAGQAAKAHKKEKAPFLDGGRAIDQKWKPLIELAEDGAKTIKKANDDWLTIQLQAQRSAEKEAEQMMEPEKAAPIPVMPTQIKSSYGRAASAKPEWTLVKVTDYALLYGHFKDSAIIKEALEDLARKAIKAGAEIPGTEREERAVSR